jgi:pyruvate kinase
MRYTKIVCTIGPSSSDVETLDRLVASGMDVARLNFSHGTHAEHADVIRRIRDVEARRGRPIAILQDLQGPKIRLGVFGPAGGERVDLDPGQRFTLVPDHVAGSRERASVAPPECLAQLAPGDTILMDDGMIQLEVEAVAERAVHCRVVEGGRISDHKGLSFAHVPLPMSCLTDKDREDLVFGIRHGVDFVAVSFVRSLADIREVRDFLDGYGARLPVIAKIERREALANLSSIAAAVDGIMVARGDLGLDVPLEEVPHIQKDLIRQARAAKIPVIVATQMLESMVAHVRPTRAEISDVCTAILDGADAIMLSAETATGRYPVEAVEVMARTALRAEQALFSEAARGPDKVDVGAPEAISDAAAKVARLLKARAIVAFTQSGFSARLISQERPDVPIVALTPFAEVQRRLALCWGVSARLIAKVHSTEEMIEEVERTLLADGTVSINDMLVIISGAPMWVAGTTNLLKVHRVGDRR